MYLADQDTVEVIELYTTNPFAASDFDKVSFAPLVAGGNFEAFEWDPSASLFLIYLAEQDTVDVFELYRTLPDNNNNVVKISGPF